MAVRFDNVADFLSRTSDVLNANAAYTIMGWFRLVVDTNDNAAIFVLDDGSNSNRDYLATTSSGTILRMQVTVGGSSTNTNGTDLTIGQWYHIAIVRESTTSLKVYLDGVLDITDTTNVGARAATASRMFVGSTNGSNALDGRVAALKAWSVGLTQAEVVRERTSVRPQRLANLHGFWPARHGSGERTLDYSGNARHWTENGTLSDEDPPPLSWGAGAQLFGASGAVISFAAALSSQSTTPSAALAVARSLSTALASQSTTPSAALAVARSLSAALSSQSSTPDVMLARLLPFVVSLASQSTTSTPTTLISLVAFVVSLASQSTTPNAALAVARALSAALASQSSTPAIDFVPILQPSARNVLSVPAQQREYIVRDRRVLVVPPKSSS